MIVRVAETVRALALAILEDRAGPEAVDPDGSIAAFVLEQQARMPGYLRVPLTGLTLVFGAWPIATRGRPFHRLPAEGRRRQLVRWRHSRLGVKRDFIRFHESLVLFAWASEADAERNPA